MRLGIYGGSFDPIHYAHLLLAETCREQAGLDRVLFVPAAVPPHKQAQPLAPDRDRLAMLQLAIGGHPQFDVSTFELERGGVSYTVQTLQAMADAHPGAELYFLMGADSLADLPGWREPRRVCELAIPLVVRRAGSPVPSLDDLAELVSAERLEVIAACQVEMPLIELSSTDLRQRAASGRSLRFRTPRAVEAYVQEHRLYRQ